MIAAAIFSALLWFGLLTMRVEQRWALAAFELALFALAAGMIAKRRLKIEIHPVGALLAVAALWAAAQAMFRISADPQRSLQAALGWTVNCAAFSLAFTVTRNVRVRERFLRAQLLFALGLSVVAVLWLITSGVLGPFVYKNQFAAYIESVLGIAIAAAVRDRRRAHVWLLIGGAALFAAVVAGGSRAGSILCLAELVVLPVIACARGWITRRTLLQVGGMALAAAAVLVAVAGWETTWKRLQEPNPYAVREDLLRSSISMIEDRPVSGFGLGAWPSAYPSYARYDDGTFVNEAHNDWAQWAAEGGLPFLIVMLALVALLVKPAWNSLWGLGVLAVFVHAWVDYPFEQRPALAAFLFAMAGVLCATSSPAGDRPGEFSPAWDRY